MVPLSISLLLLVFLPEAQAFVQSSASNAANSRDHVVRSSGKNDRLYFGVFGTTTTSLCVSPIPSGDRPPPRRTLKKVRVINDVLVFYKCVLCSAHRNKVLIPPSPLRGKTNVVNVNA